MKSIATILLLGTLAVAASTLSPALEGWGPLFLLCAGMALLVAALVAAEPVKAPHGAKHRKAA